MTAEAIEIVTAELRDRLSAAVDSPVYVGPPLVEDVPVPEGLPERGTRVHVRRRMSLDVLKRAAARVSSSGPCTASANHRCEFRPPGSSSRHANPAWVATSLRPRPPTPNQCSLTTSSR